ncbi:histidine kinase [Paenibacillus macerans]|uniref:sensor histidine kinase n=1 Tax=Paenibacillus macerans TaxID=44252 RepID=UPI002DB86883|nr:histidine kinase [Paenibacillus macerans]MEC0332602.1 histidine kinase [Paenibacillus macerans]
MKEKLHQFYSKIRFKKIRNRFLAAMIVLSIPPLFLLGYLSFNIAKDTLLETNKKTDQVHLRSSSEAADLIFRNIVNLNRSVILNDEIRDQLRASQNPDEASDGARHEKILSQLQKMVNNLFINSRYVDSICLVDLQFKAHCLGRSDNLGVYEGDGQGEKIKLSPWYAKAVESQGQVEFFPDNVLGDTSYTFSTVKLFRDSENISGEPIGILIINISKSIFDSIFTETDKQAGEYIVLTSASELMEVIYPRNSYIELNGLAGGKNDLYPRLEKQGYMVVDFKNETTGWTFLHIIKLSELLKQSRQIGTVTTIISSMIALVALVLSYFISGSITRPLLQLKKMMLDWTKGKRDFGETFEHDEIGAIGQTFKKMASENEELSERLVHTELKEREAELRALQAQIKPHFLYNTLDSIYWMATIQNNQDVAQMAFSLSESFKLSLNKGKETIPVYKELQHIEHYMTIQNIRYNHRFKYIEDVPSQIKSMEILKLLLQPLVENAIYHGLEPKVGEGTVSLQGAMEGGFLTFVIEDDGVGIEDMEQTEQGYGLHNVKERIKRFYGEASELIIDSKPGSGTRVELRIQQNGNEVKLDV